MLFAKNMEGGFREIFLNLIDLVMPRISSLEREEYMINKTEQPFFSSSLA
jgi:hypothetical protein